MLGQLPGHLGIDLARDLQAAQDGKFKALWHPIFSGKWRYPSPYDPPEPPNPKKRGLEAPSSLASCPDRRSQRVRAGCRRALKKRATEL
jgi:hypothetical protein